MTPWIGLTRLIAVRVDGPGPTLQLEFDDGLAARVDLSAMARPGSVTAAFADPKFFASVKLGPRGRSLEWPGDIELCTDALRLQAEASR